MICKGFIFIYTKLSNFVSETHRHHVLPYNNDKHNCSVKRKLMEKQMLNCYFIKFNALKIDFLLAIHFKLNILLIFIFFIEVKSNRIHILFVLYYVTCCCSNFFTMTHIKKSLLNLIFQP